MAAPESDGRSGELAAVTDAVGRGDRALALALALDALRQVAHPVVLQRVADVLLREIGRTPGLAEVPELWCRYGGALARSGHLTDARQALELALALEPDAYRARLDAGTAAFMCADLDTARMHFERAAALRPDDPEPLASIAAVAARQQRHGDARAAAEHALALQPQLVTAHIAVARADLNEGHAAAAEQRMSRLLADVPLSDAQRVGVLDLRADARDALDNTAGAFADYGERNAILKRTNAPRIAAEVSERRVDQARRLVAWLDSAPPGPWRARPGPDTVREVREHVFLLGFPRSGTTLVEKALAGHPEVVTLEEVDVLAAAGGHLLVDAVAMESLVRLSAADADAVRSAYWQGVRATVGAALPGRVLVDKMPLHTVALPLIARLFPDAKILFALRDPRDVVLSCFRRRFQINAAMFEFLTLEGAARYYDQVMALAQSCRSLLPVAVHEVRHERVVADFEGELQRVLAFIGLDWHPAVRDFAARARARLVTPSDLQLAGGLSAEGLGQWRRYRDSLAPVMEVLEPWALRLGYPAAGAPGDGDR